MIILPHNMLSILLRKKTKTNKNKQKQNKTKQNKKRQLIM